VAGTRSSAQGHSAAGRQQEAPNKALQQTAAAIQFPHDIKAHSAAAAAELCVRPQNMTSDEGSILDRLKRAIADGKHPGPVAEADIAAAEKELGVRFPTSYRVFLTHFGAAWLPSSVEVAGLGPGRCTDPTPPLWEHVVDVTTMVRRDSRDFIPHEYVRFSSDGEDCAFYLDTGNVDANGESPVVVLGPGRDSVIIAHSFVEFVEGAVSGRLEY
jgi:antitoxin YobK